MEVAVYIAVIACIALVFVGRPTDRSVALFSDTYSVPLTSTNVELLRGYIWWSRAWRIGPAVLAIITLDLLDGNGEEPGGIPLRLIVAAYAIGTLIGEILRPRPDVSATATASMDRRRVKDFVSSRFLWVCATAGASVVVGAIWHLTHAGSDQPWFDSTSSVRTAAGQRFVPWYVLVITVGSVLITTLAWTLANRLAQAPMTRVDSDRRAVDHAVRTAALLTIGGAALLAVATVGFHLSNAGFDASENGSVAWRLLLGLATFTSGFAALAGGFLTWKAVPRFGAIWRRLPEVQVATDAS